MNHSFYSFLLGSHMITLLISQTLMNNYNHNSYKVIIMIIIIHKDSCLQSFTIKILDLPAPPNNHISSHLLTNPFQLLCFRIWNCLVDVWCILMSSVKSCIEVSVIRIHQTSTKQSHILKHINCEASVNWYLEIWLFGDAGRSQIISWNRKCLLCCIYRCFLVPWSQNHREKRFRGFVYKRRNFSWRFGWIWLMEWVDLIKMVECQWNVTTGVFFWVEKLLVKGVTDRAYFQRPFGYDDHKKWYLNNYSGDFNKIKIDYYALHNFGSCWIVSRVSILKEKF